MSSLPRHGAVESERESYLSRDGAAVGVRRVTSAPRAARHVSHCTQAPARTTHTSLTECPLINIRIVAKTWPAVSYLHINAFLYSSFYGAHPGALHGRQAHSPCVGRSAPCACAARAGGAGERLGCARTKVVFAHSYFFMVSKGVTGHTVNGNPSLLRNISLTTFSPTAAEPE